MNENNLQNNKSRIIKSGIWYTVTSFITKGISFLTIPIFTRILSKAEFGDFNNFTSWISLVTIISTLSLSSSLSSGRFDYKDEIYDFIKSLLLLGSFWTFFVFLITRINHIYFDNLFSMEDKWVIFMFCCIVLAPASEMFQCIQQFEYKYKINVMLSLFTAASTVFVSLLLVNLMENKLEGRIIGAFLPSIIINLVLYIWFIIKGRRVSKKYCIYALKICLPYVPHLLAMVVLSSTDRVMITKICGAEATALYSISYTCALAVQILLNSYNSAFSPWQGDMLYEKKYNVLYKISTPYTILFAIPIVGIMLIAPEAILILGGKTYLSAVYVMPPVMLGCFFQFLYCMYVNIEQFEKRTLGMAFASVMAAVLNVILNAIFIPKYGYIAAAYTTLIGYMFLFIMHFFLVKHMGLSGCFNTRNMVIISSIICLVGIAMNYLYKNDILRYIVLFIYLCLFIIFILKKKNQFIKILKEMKG